MRRIARLTLALAGMAVVAELAARHEGFGNPVLYRPAPSGYEPVPGQHVRRLGHEVTINAFGLRGPEIAPRPAPGVTRIMLLGDSVINGGTQLDDSQTISAVAGRALRQAGASTEVINASAGGWSLFDEVAWIHQHGLFGARVVVWTINFMDLDQAPDTAAIIDSNPSFPGHRPASALSEILFRYALPRLGLGPRAADNGSIMGGDFDTRQFAAVRALVRDQARAFASQGIPLIVVYHDGRAPMPPARLAAENTFLADLRAQHIPVVRTTLATAADPARLYIDGIHPNAVGAQIIGTQIATAVLAR
jgi:hypothetical protein